MSMVHATHLAVDAVLDLGVKALGVVNNVINSVTGLSDAFTAAGLNPSVQGAGQRTMAGVSAAATLIPGLEEGGAALRLTDGMTLGTGKALDAAATFLGEGYAEASPGRFLSSDGLRQVRMGESDILGLHGGGSHMNFETLAPNPARAGRNSVTQNLHIYLAS
jgi:hypothetical protein